MRCCLSNLFRVAGQGKFWQTGPGKIGLGAGLLSLLAFTDALTTLKPGDAKTFCPIGLIDGTPMLMIGGGTPI